MTQFPELFAALAAPFSDKEVKILPKGRGMKYITARTVMNRLDSVLGPENWEDSYVPGEKGVLCVLTITLPDGRKVTKADAGGHAGMQDEGDDEKSGFSDAFKRAAVKFGIGRVLYGDGVPTYQKQQPSTGPAQRASAGQRQAPAVSQATEGEGADGWRAFAEKALEGACGRWGQEVARDGLTPPDAWKQLVTATEFVEGVLTLAITDERIRMEEVAKDGAPGQLDMRKAKDALRGLWARDEAFLRVACDQFLTKRLGEARAACKGKGKK